MIVLLTRHSAGRATGDWSALVVASAAPGLRSSSPTAAPIGVGWADRLLHRWLLLLLVLVLLLLLLLQLIRLGWCRTAGVELMLQHTSQLNVLVMIEPQRHVLYGAFLAERM